MTVFGAMLIDAYRELNSKKLFWITLGISLMLVVGYGSIGFNETGMSMFYGLWDIDSSYLKRGSPKASMLSRAIFSSFMVQIWLAWAATILALISTTSIFPDFVAGGNIEVLLAKPISRLRLFLYKYIASLMFVFAQVAIFCIGIFLCLGARLGEWNWMIFLAVPIVLVFFSYLFAINVLVGVWTRSALAALLATLIAWTSLFGLNMAEFVSHQTFAGAEVRMEGFEASMAAQEAALAKIPEGSTQRPLIEARLEKQRAAVAEAEVALARGRRIHGVISKVLIVLPKTSDTIALLDRWLVSERDVNILDLLAGNVEETEPGVFAAKHRDPGRDALERIDEADRAKSLWYIIGTSLLFEAVVLALAAWIFCRRDY
jgi:ABC-type transport system involved in multi-copper enzyme maturation permease subunit